MRLFILFRLASAGAAFNTPALKCRFAQRRRVIDYGTFRA
jgi:hypothetical protein